MTLIVIAATLLIAYMAERKQLKQGSKMTRWITYGVLLVSGGIWYIISNNYDFPHPSVWVHQMLEPFDPID